jgi:hypothetical protein
MPTARAIGSSSPAGSCPARVPPAQQRLHPDRQVVAQVDHRLEDQVELAALGRAEHCCSAPSGG